MTPNLAPGYRFMPTDAELIIWYLLVKVLGKQLLSDAVIEGEIYGDDARLPKADDIGDREQYMFVKIKKNPNGTKTNRKTKNGHWKDTGHKKEIKDESGIHIGTMTSFVLKETNKSRRKRNLLMDEYTLEGSLKNINSEGWVLCKIKQSNRSPKRQAEEEGDISAWMVDNRPWQNVLFGTDVGPSHMPVDQPWEMMSPLTPTLEGNHYNSENHSAWVDELYDPTYDQWFQT